MTATYRVGNGTPGNVGAESLVFLAYRDARIVGCTNPLPASAASIPKPPTRSAAARPPRS